MKIGGMELRKFQNNTGVKKKLKIIDQNEKLGFRWRTIKPGDMVIMPVEQGHEEGFTPKYREPEPSIPLVHAEEIQPSEPTKNPEPAPEDNGQAQAPPAQPQAPPAQPQATAPQQPGAAPAQPAQPQQGETPAQPSAPNQQAADEIAKAFKKKLMAIDGIGAETADDIIGIYRNEEYLRYVISKGKKIRIRNDLAHKVVAVFSDNGN